MQNETDKMRAAVIADALSIAANSLDVARAALAALPPVAMRETPGRDGVATWALERIARTQGIQTAPDTTGMPAAASVEEKPAEPGTPNGMSFFTDDEPAAEPDETKAASWRENTQKLNALTNEMRAKSAQAEAEAGRVGQPASAARHSGGGAVHQAAVRALIGQGDVMSRLAELYADPVPLALRAAAANLAYHRVGIFRGIHAAMMEAASPRLSTGPAAMEALFGSTGLYSVAAVMARAADAQTSATAADCGVAALLAHTSGLLAPGSA